MKVEERPKNFWAKILSSNINTIYSPACVCACVCSLASMSIPLDIVVSNAIELR